MEPPPEPLYFKAELARDDAVERLRQLSRCVRQLIPALKPLTPDGTPKPELQAAFAKLVGRGGPAVEVKEGHWWHVVEVFLDWAQGVLSGDEPVIQQASSAVKLHKGQLCIDRAALRALGLFTEAWPVPMTPAALQRSNAAAAAKAGFVARPPAPAGGKARAKAEQHGEEAGPSEAAPAAQRRPEAQQETKKAGGAGSKRTAAGSSKPAAEAAPAPVVELGCARCRYRQCSDCRRRAAKKLVSGDKSSGLVEGTFVPWWFAAFD